MGPAPPLERAEPAEAGALPSALLRTAPEDFVVEELPAYAASGRGEHVFVTFRKTGRTTQDAVRALALAVGADPRDAGFAGMKDRHAITTQTASLHVPLSVDPEPLLGRASIPGVEVLAVARHDNKLKPGHLAGNRFRVTLRGVDPVAAPSACTRLLEAGAIGVPNAFGPQRFGRDGDNPARALAWISGKARPRRGAASADGSEAAFAPPRDKREQRLLFSALQSLWFNEVLGRRERDGTWAEVLPGDLAKRRDSGGLFLVPLEGPELDEARARGAALEIGPTGPMFGKKMRWPEGAPGALEREVLMAAIGDPRRLDAFAHAGEGTRRPLRLEVGELQVTVVSDDPPSGASPADGSGSTGEPGSSGQRIVVSFVLPKGGYATTVLGRVFRLVDVSAARPAHAGPALAGDSARTAPDAGAFDAGEAPSEIEP